MKIPKMLNITHQDMCLACEKGHKKRDRQFCGDACSKRMASYALPQLLKIPTNHTMYLNGMLCHLIPYLWIRSH